MEASIHSWPTPSVNCHDISHHPSSIPVGWKFISLTFKKRKGGSQRRMNLLSYHAAKWIAKLGYKAFCLVPRKVTPEFLSSSTIDGKCTLCNMVKQTGWKQIFSWNYLLSSWLLQLEIVTLVPDTPAHPSVGKQMLPGQFQFLFWSQWHVQGCFSMWWIIVIFNISNDKIVV